VIVLVIQSSKKKKKKKLYTACKTLLAAPDLC
jgi:hypothetical protein